MSGTNFGRSSQLSYHQVNSQKTLIYDLRSELSNLKNQFSRLISRPTDLTVKSKIENKPISKPRYSCVQSEIQTQQSKISSISEGQLLRKSQEISPRLNFNRVECQPGANNYSSQSCYRLSSVYRKNSTGQSQTSGCSSGLTENSQRVDNDQKVEGDNAIINSANRIKQFSTFYKKIHNNTPNTQSSKPTITKPDQSNQPNHLVTSDHTLQTQLATLQQKSKHLQHENMLTIQKMNTTLQKNTQLQNRIRIMQLQQQQLKSQNNKKDEKNTKLQQQLRQLSNKVSRSNQHTMEINRDKNKEIQNLKLYYTNQIKNVQKEWEKKLGIQKKEIEGRSQGAMREMRQVSQGRIGQLVNERNKIQGELVEVGQKYEKLKGQYAEIERKRVGLECLVKEKNNEISKLNESVRVLSQRVSQLEKQNNLYKIKPQTKQIGINTEAKQQKPQQPQQTKAQTPIPTVSVPTPTCTSPTSTLPSSPPVLPSSDPQKQLQQKLNIYLNNIDKQSTKIKQQKTQLQKYQRIIQQNNRIVCQKQATIRNIMRDFKTLQKQLNQNRRVKREVQVILDDYNQSINRLSLCKLNNKYVNVSE